MKLLLHICCAPCAIHPFKALEPEGFNAITGFFYNPNIHPQAEYVKRSEALRQYSQSHKMPVLFGSYDPEEFFKCISGNEKTPARCSFCWRMRLEKTASYAAVNNYNAFTTTLLVSPYQDQDAIKEIGEKAAARFNTKFLYKDFRKGFGKAQGQAKCEGLYRQKYCGCVFSEKERHDKRDR